MRSLSGWRLRVRSSWVRPSCLTAVVLPVAAGPETIKPRRAPISRWLSRHSSRPCLRISRTVEVVTTINSAWCAIRASSYSNRAASPSASQSALGSKVKLAESVASTKRRQPSSVVVGCRRSSSWPASSLGSGSLGLGITTTSPPSGGLLTGVEDRQRDDLGAASIIRLSAGILGGDNRGWGISIRALAVAPRRPRVPQASSCRLRPGGCGRVGARHHTLALARCRLGRFALRVACRHGAAAGRVEQRGDGVGDRRLGWLLALVDKLLADVVPSKLPEGHRDAVQVLPIAHDPAAVPVVANPDTADVVGIVVDLPAVLLGPHARRLPPEEVEVDTVVGAVVELDAVGVTEVRPSE